MQLEEVPPHRLLEPVRSVDVDVRPCPEVLELGTLPLVQRVSTELDRTVERTETAIDELDGWDVPRGVVGEELLHLDRHARLRLDGEHDLAEVLAPGGDASDRRVAVHAVVHADTHRHA